MSTGVIAAGAVLQYLYETQKNDAGPPDATMTVYTTGQFMMLDTSTQTEPGAY